MVGSALCAGNQGRSIVKRLLLAACVRTLAQSLEICYLFGPFAI
jgi:hypothetical protein